MAITKWSTKLWCAHLQISRSNMVTNIVKKLFSKGYYRHRKFPSFFLLIFALMFTRFCERIRKQLIDGNYLKIRPQDVSNLVWPDWLIYLFIVPKTVVLWTKKSTPLLRDHVHNEGITVATLLNTRKMDGSSFFHFQRLLVSWCFDSIGAVGTLHSFLSTSSNSLTPHVVVVTLHQSHPEALRRRSQSTRSFQD